MYAMGVHASVSICHESGFKCLAADPEREINFEFYTACMIKKKFC